MKLSEIRKGYEDTSGTFSSRARTLALSGIAIAWLFMNQDKSEVVQPSLIVSVCGFVITILLDLLQNYILSVNWYCFYKQMRKEGKKEEDEVNEPESRNKLGWILYHVKLGTLILGYLAFIYYFIFDLNLVECLHIQEIRILGKKVLR